VCRCPGEDSSEGNVTPRAAHAGYGGVRPQPTQSYACRRGEATSARSVKNRLFTSVLVAVGKLASEGH
jgi:hypothetical protein